MSRALGIIRDEHRTTFDRIVALAPPPIGAGPDAGASITRRS